MYPSHPIIHPYEHQMQHVNFAKPFLKEGNCIPEQPLLLRLEKNLEVKHAKKHKSGLSDYCLLCQAAQCVFRMPFKNMFWGKVLKFFSKSVKGRIDIEFAFISSQISKHKRTD